MKRLSISSLAGRLERLGTFSPFAAIATEGPGSRMILASVERAAERALHVARGVFLGTIGVSMIVLGRHIPAAVLVVAAVGFPAAGVLWLVVWRRLEEARPPRWLPYALIAFDAWLAIRGPLAVRTPLYHGLHLDQYLSPSDLGALAGPILTLVAITGAFRLNTAMALFSTAVALVSYGTVAWALDLPHNLALGSGGVIAFAGMLGVQAARVFRYAMLKAAEEAVLERYVPEALIRELAQSGEPLGAGREVEITVLIIDIRGFTARAEQLTPREAVAFLNGYFSVVVGPLVAEGAVLDKYIGDGVLAFFEGSDHQSRAARAARAILNAIETYNRSRPRGHPIAIGIALHAGMALVGTVGAAVKREYTAIADTVSVAARLEELNKTFHSLIVASEAVISATLPAERADFLGPVVVPIRGRDAQLTVFYLPAPA